MLEDRTLTKDKSLHFYSVLSAYGLVAVTGLLLLLNLSGMWSRVFGLDTAVIITLLAGYKTFNNSISALLDKKISADLAICVAAIAALLVGEYLAAAEAMFIVMVGESLESYAAGRTEAAIHRFIERLPRLARLVKDGTEREVDAATLQPDDLIVVRAGEWITSDGIIEQGVSSIDESSITGESLPCDKQAGDEVFSGTLNGNGMLRIRVIRAGPETVLARVIKLVEEAKGKRAPVERLADRYARYFLPALLLAGALTYYFTGNWLRTVAVLIVACPCALILATPTAMVAAIGGLARCGILVRGGTVLQNAARVDAVVFDKTGTVTEGQFEITRVIASDGDEDSLLTLAAAAEQGSSHTLAHVIIDEARRRKLSLPASQDTCVIPGRGVACRLLGRKIRAGSAAFLSECGIGGTEALLREADRSGATAVLIGDDNRLVGAILLRDRIREGVREAVSQIRASGLSYLAILTGDRRRAAEAMADEVAIYNVEADLLPEHKLQRVQQLTFQGCTVAMVGDGINDAPALAVASVGIAVAGASDVTAEAADVIYMPHSLSRLPQLFEVSRRAVHTAWLNIVLFAGAVNFLAVLACATGRLGPIGAAVTHQLSSFCVMMNSLRLLRVERSSSARLARLIADTPIPALWSQLSNLRPTVVFQWLLVRRHAVAKSALIAAACLFLINGFYAVQPDEVGIIERFGKKVDPFSLPGLHYKLPWPVERLTRIQAHRVRVIEVGFRSNSNTTTAEPAAYEWNVQHRSGRFQSRPEESFMLTGDQNMIELNAVVHYAVNRPDAFLFRQMDGDNTIRQTVESVIQGITTTTKLDDLLTTGRQAVEGKALVELQRRMDKYDTGIRILRFKLEDVHPSLEVVSAFREVSAAFEEKNRMINEAEGYRNEQIALARGNAQARVKNASAYALTRTNQADGDASRFTQQEQALRTAPGPSETRMYLETMEQALSGRKKLIIDSTKGRRHLMLLEDGVEVPPLGTAIQVPQPTRPPKE
jgi:HflK protein